MCALSIDSYEKWHRKKPTKKVPCWVPTVMEDDWRTLITRLVNKDIPISNPIYDIALFAMGLGIEAAILSNGKDRQDFIEFLVSEEIEELPPILQEGLLRFSYECKEEYLAEWRAARDRIYKSMCSNGIDPQEYLTGLIGE